MNEKLGLTQIDIAMLSETDNSKMYIYSSRKDACASNVEWFLYDLKLYAYLPTAFIQRSLLLLFIQQKLFISLKLKMYEWTILVSSLWPLRLQLLLQPNVFCNHWPVSRICCWGVLPSLQNSASWERLEGHLLSVKPQHFYWIEVPTLTSPIQEYEFFLLSHSLVVLLTCFGL